MKINLANRILLRKIAGFHVAGDADDGTCGVAVFDPASNLRTDRIALGPVLSRQELIDNRDLRAVGCIALAKIPAAQDRNSQGSKITGIDFIPARHRRILSRGASVTLDHSHAGITVAAEW